MLSIVISLSLGKTFFSGLPPLSILLLFLRLILSPTGFFAKFAADMSSKKKRMYDNNGPGIFSSFIGVLFEKNIAANPTFGKIHIQCVVGEEMASPITPKEMEEES